MSEIVFLTDPEGLPEGGGVLRAGGTDLQERLRTANATPRILDLMGIEHFTGISFGAGLGLEHDHGDAGEEAVTRHGVVKDAARTDGTDGTDGTHDPDGTDAARTDGIDGQGTANATSGAPGHERGGHVGGGTRIGAGTRMSVVAEALADSYPALAQTTASLATPQVRAVGTIGGNLLQHTRCWYARHPDLSCFKTGGNSCPARDGRHLYGVVFDTSACVHPHPSSIAMALLLHDAEIAIAGKDRRTLGELLGDGSDPTRDNLLGDGEVVTAIHLPPPWEEERAAYFRAISRFEAEWPLVEAVCRVQVDQDERVKECGIAVGGVAPVPRRMRHAEDALRGATLDHDSIAAASAACAKGASPLPETGYKVDLLVATVREVLERVAVA